MSALPCPSARGHILIYVSMSVEYVKDTGTDITNHEYNFWVMVMIDGHFCAQLGG